MKSPIFIMMSIVGSSKVSTTPARTTQEGYHRWKCIRCGDDAETEGTLPPANYNCKSAEAVHAWVNIDDTLAPVK